MKSKRRLSVVLLAAVLVLAGFLVFFSRRHVKLYEVTVLPSLGGRTSRPCALNDLNQIVGVAEVASGSSHLFLWDREKGMQDLGPADDGDFDINNAGQIAGSATDPNGNVQAFLWDPKDGKKLLGTLGGAESFAWALNNRGQVVGSSQPATGSHRAFIWDKPNGMRDLGTFGGHGSIAKAVNDAGQVLGLLLTDAISQHPEPCYWDSTDPDATSATPLLPPDDYPGGSDINNNGYVLGRDFV